MGQQQSAVNSTGKPVNRIKAKNGQWVYNPQTGYKFVVAPLISGPEVKRVDNGDGSQTWGPYKKTYTQSAITGLDVFTPPDTIDGVKVLCRCRMIRQYMENNLGGDLALVSGQPACWEDSQGLWGPSPDTYTLTVNHPNFALWSKGGLGAVGSLARLRGMSGPLPRNIGTLMPDGTPVLYAKQPPMPSSIMINPVTGKQTVTYGPTYTTTTKILGGKTFKRRGNKKNKTVKHYKRK
jgi:hypothetical protein